MGLYRIKSKHLQIAQSGHGLEPCLRELDSPRRMLRHYERQAQALDLRVLPKTSLFGPNWAKLTTTFYKQIRLGEDFETRSEVDRAITWAHEFVHVRQWRIWGRANFATKYVGSPGHGWAFEMQAYRETLRAMAVLGVSKQIRRHRVETQADRLLDSYLLLRQLREDQLRRHTHEVLEPELDFTG